MTFAQGLSGKIRAHMHAILTLFDYAYPDAKGWGTLFVRQMRSPSDSAQEALYSFRTMEESVRCCSIRNRIPAKVLTFVRNLLWHKLPSARAKHCQSTAHATVMCKSSQDDSVQARGVPARMVASSFAIAY